MKHVRSLEAEPPLLGGYCRSPRSRSAAPASEATGVWDRFKKRAPSAYKELRDLLVKRQYGLCMYCERLLVNNLTGLLEDDSYLVEHVLPKAGAAGRVLDWNNLALSCWVRGAPREMKTCADAKLFHDLPSGCDPRELPLIPSLVDVSLDGILSQNLRSGEHFDECVDALSDAIRILNLNAESLRVKRQKVRDDLRGQFLSLLQALREMGLEEAEMTLALDEFAASRLSPQGDHQLLISFWTTERIELGALAESWIAANMQIFQ